MPERFIAVISSAFVRDAQYCRSEDADLIHGDWVDLHDAEIFLGIYDGPEEAARETAERYAQTNHIRLIKV